MNQELSACAKATAETSQEQLNSGFGKMTNFGQTVRSCCREAVSNAVLNTNVSNNQSHINQVYKTGVSQLVSVKVWQ